MSDRPSSSKHGSQRSQHHDGNDSSRRSQGQTEDGTGSGSERQEMKEIKRAPPLPAVKGTIGGIESPRRSQFSSPTTSNFPAHLPPNSSTQSRAQTRDQERSQEQNSMEPVSESDTESKSTTVQRYINPDRPVFRADPTLRTCFDGLNLEKRDEIKRLFGVA